MELNVAEDGVVRVISAEGRIDGSNAREFEEAVKNAIQDDDSYVVLDLGGLTYISSAGLRAILLTAKLLWNQDSKFAVCSLSAQIKEVFEIAGFDRVLMVCDDTAAARVAFEL